MASAGFVSDWAILTKEWVIAAWISATVDWIASKVPVQPGLIGTLLSTAQLAATVSIISGVTDFFSQKASDPFLYIVIWTMSPTATSRLTRGYTKFHRILYGSAPLPKLAAGPQCPDGKCNEHKVQ